MKVALLCGTFAPRRDGVSDYVARLADGLGAEGHSVSILTSRRCAEAATDPRVEGVADGWGMSGVWEAARSPELRAADIIHVQHSPGVFESRWGIEFLPRFLPRSRPPLVTTLHEPEAGRAVRVIPEEAYRTIATLGEKAGRWERNSGLLGMESDALVVTHHSPPLARRIRRARPRLVEIPLASNLRRSGESRESARRRVEAATGWPAEMRLVVFFGFLHPVKGIEPLLDAMALLRQRHEDVRLGLVGGVESLVMDAAAADRYRRELEARVAGLGLEKVVHLTGWVEEETASSWLTAADLGVLPFNQGLTGKSGSLLAMIDHGLPVVGTTADGEAELGDEDAIVLVPPRSPQALAGAIARVLFDDGAMARARRGVSSFSREQGWEALVRRHLDLYFTLSPAAGPPHV